jgi:ABC-type glycerol-3-phosphate transport system substrate-binding protein
MVTKLKAAGLVPVAAFGIQDGNGIAFPLGNLLQTACGMAKYDNLIYNWQKSVKPTTTWTSPCAVNALTTVNDWANSGVFGTSPATETTNAGISLFASGKAAMFSSGSWDASSPEWTTPLSVGWMLPPPPPNAADPKTRFPVVDGDGLAVASHSKNVALAKAFLAFMSTKAFESSKAYLKAPGAPPRLDAKVSGYPPLALNMFSAVKTIGTAPLMLDVPYAAKIEPLLDTMVAGQASVSTTAQALASDSTAQRQAGG